MPPRSSGIKTIVEVAGCDDSVVIRAMKRILIGWFLMVLLVGVASATPAGVAGALVEVTSSSRIGSIWGKFLGLYRSDGTFTVLRSESHVSAQPVYTTSYSGTYTFSPANAIGGEAFLTISTNLTQTTRLVYKDDFSGEAIDSPALMNSFQIYPHTNVSGPCNVSNRAYITDAHISITGFIISGDRGKWVLIRGVGPTLKNFGIETAATEVGLDVHSTTEVIADAKAWGSDPNLVEGYQALFQYVGAFPLNAGSKDSAVFLHLAPGAYTIQSRAVSGAGEILTEVYFLPNEG